MRVEDLTGSGTFASLFEPPGVPRSALVACHGGLDGLDGLVAERCVELAERGLLVAAPHFRGEDGKSDPAERRVGETDVADAVACLEWLAGHSDLPLFLWGNSRGGLVALLAGATSGVAISGCAATAPIASLASFYEIMAPRGHDSAREIELRLGGTPDSAAIAYDAYDGALIASRAVPVLLAHAADDPVVPFADSLALAGRLAAGGSPVTAMLRPQGGHRVVGSEPAVWQALLAFLDIPAAGEAPPLDDVGEPIGGRR